MNSPEILGLTAGVFTSVALLPQLIKIVKEKEAKNVSLVMLFVIIIGNGLWIIYGFVREDIPIISTNIFSELVNLMLLFFTLRYKKKEA